MMWQPRFLGGRCGAVILAGLCEGSDPCLVNLEDLCTQVSALALCKLNKTDVFLRWASPSKRHEAEQDLFWRLDEVPQEALDVLQVGLYTACPFNLTFYHFIPGTWQLGIL